MPTTILGHAWEVEALAIRRISRSSMNTMLQSHRKRGINLYLTLMTGGVPINTFRNLIDMDWLNNLIDNNSCIKGRCLCRKPS